jgi:hypothetical protein
VTDYFSYGNSLPAPIKHGPPGGGRRPVYLALIEMAFLAESGGLLLFNKINVFPPTLAPIGSASLSRSRLHP